MDVSLVGILLLLDALAFSVGLMVGTSVRSRLIAVTIIKLQNDVIHLQGMNLALAEQLEGMRAEIRELRDILSREQQALRHMRNNVTQAMQGLEGVRAGGFRI